MGYIGTDRVVVERHLQKKMGSAMETAMQHWKLFLCRGLRTLLGGSGGLSN